MEKEYFDQLISLLDKPAALKVDPSVTGRISSFTVDSAGVVSFIFQYFSNDLMGIQLTSGDFVILEEEDDSTKPDTM